MKHNTAPALNHNHSLHADRVSVFSGLNTWIKAKSPVWEENRIGITATAIFLQVTFAAIMICVAGMAGASPFAFGAGILFAFMADALVLAQSPMRWIMAMMLASLIVNISLVIYFITLL
ncbi:hypothetical protein LZZ85_15765 [Terrimonas sp. NA20]|uniref:Uncharacterized protein n=1 Tax=Terrimonas ginsenosidimutans TaxID=2908004 RepID=A0ABS9KTU5_9BACT|nr:hypothetical protein [Terrimonas ginsenosidimutans]MCG2615757.1 hypothetical protein [Terrimonas ginsenosidimutans]